MSEPGWAENAVRVGRFEFRRSVRSIRESTGRFVLMLLGALFPAAMFLLLGALFVGSVSVDTVPVSDPLRGTVAMFWAFAVFLVAQRVVSTRPRPAAESVLLTAASTRSVVLGLALAETLRILAYVAAPLAVLTGLLAYALSSLALLVTVPLGVVVTVLTAVVVGSLAGYGVALILARSPFVARHRTALGVPLVIVLMGAFFAFQAPELVGLDRATFAWVPSGWFADLVAVGTPLAGSNLRAGGAFAWTVAVLAGGGLLLESAATALWFEDDVDPDADGDAEAVGSGAAEATGTDASATGDVAATVGTGAETGGATRRAAADSTAWSGLSAAVSPFVVPSPLDLPTRRVAEMTLLRARREPRRLTFLLTPVFVFAGALSGVGSLSDLLSTLPLLCAVFVPWGLGAVTTLNPLGDEGALLPVTLVAATPAQFVRGVLVPGVAYGVPAAVVVVGVAAVAGGYALPVVLGLAAVAAFVTLVAAPAGAAVGVSLPRFSAVSVGRSGDVLPPRMLAVALHGLLVAVPAGALVLLVTASVPVPAVATLASRATGLSPLAARATAAFFLVLAGVLVALSGYRIALHLVRTYEPT